MIKKILKWAFIVIVLLIVAGFGAFLYFIPPFFISSPDTFSKPEAAAAPPVTNIADPAERALAERGRYLVMTSDCFGCHGTPGPQGLQFDKYLSGGVQFRTHHGTFVTRNLTSDKETGLARRKDEEAKRVLRSGLFPDGHVTSYRLMPWGSFTSFTEEDIHAIVVYLRHLPAVRHQIPEPAAPTLELADPTALEEVYGGQDYGGGGK